MPRVNTKILTTVILVVFRGLKFESDADIGGKDSFRSGTIYTGHYSFFKSKLKIFPGIVSVKASFFNILSILKNLLHQF